MHEGKILIFVPLPIFSLGLKAQFERWGFSPVELAYSTAQAVNSIRELAPDLLLLDGDSMQEADCRAMGQFLKQEQAVILVIFFSKDPKKALQSKQTLQWLGSYDWLPKPCHAEELWHTLESL